MNKNEKETPAEDAGSQAGLSPLWFFATETILIRPKEKLLLTALGQQHPKLPGCSSLPLGKSCHAQFVPTLPNLKCPSEPSSFPNSSPVPVWNFPGVLLSTHNFFKCHGPQCVITLSPAFQACFWGLGQMSHYSPSKQSGSPCTDLRTGDSRSLLLQQSKNRTPSHWFPWEGGATRSLKGRMVFTLTSSCHLKANVISMFKYRGHCLSKEHSLHKTSHCCQSILMCTPVKTQAQVN